MKKLTHEVGKVAYHILIGEFESWEAITSQSVLLNSVFALMLIEKNMNSDLDLVASEQTSSVLTSTVRGEEQLPSCLLGVLSQ